jgi:cytochrome P450
MFDHHSREYADGWKSIYAAARGSGCPVIHSENYGGFHVLTRYADVVAAAADYRALSSERSFDDRGQDVGLGTTIPPRPVRLGNLEMDPPVSTLYRRLMNKWFTRAAIERGRARVQEIARWSLGRYSAGAEVDMVGPFQRMLLFDLVGLPLDRWLGYREESGHAPASDFPADDGLLPGERRAIERARFFGFLADSLRAEVIHQREHGGTGIIADLATAEVNGDLLPLEIVNELAVMLVAGGDETTVSTITSTVLHLYRHPEERARLAADPGLLGAAVDEVLRYCSPALTSARNVVAPCSYAGRDFVPGERLLLSWASANFDESTFAEPDTVDLGRTPNRHVAFGVGPHRCIGAILAKTAAECFLEELLRVSPDYEVLEDRIRPAYGDIARFNGWDSLPIRLCPRYSGGIYPGLPELTEARIAP